MKGIIDMTKKKIKFKQAILNLAWTKNDLFESKQCVSAVVRKDQFLTSIIPYGPIICKVNSPSASLRNNDVILVLISTNCLCVSIKWILYHRKKTLD